MYTVWIGSVLLAGYWISVSSALITSCKSKISFRNKEIGANWHWRYTNVCSLLKCAIECYSELNCRTFSFSHSKNVCLGYIKTMDAYKKNISDVTEGKTILFQTCRGFISSSCNQRDECNFHKSVCFSGLCLCVLGLYYSPKQNSCKRGCSEYGEEMDVYEGRSIYLHNTRWWDNMPLSTCKQKCLQATSFICRTFDYHHKHGLCRLSKVGYKNVARKYRERAPKWDLWQRRCK